MSDQEFSAWESLKPDSEQLQAQKAESLEKALEVAGYYREAFSTDHGKLVLNLMIAATIGRPIINPEDTQFAAGIKEGRAQMVRDIMNQIEFSETGGVPVQRAHWITRIFNNKPGEK